MSDDDLIRRGDAVRLALDEGNWHGRAIAERIRALPARGVGEQAAFVRGMEAALDMIRSMRASEDVVIGRDLICTALEMAVTKNRAALAPTDAATATEKGGDAHAVRRAPHEASLGVTAGADAAHVNETPKSEHDGADVLTDAAQAREAALTVPDEIELYRIIKRSGAKKRIDIARAVSAHLEPMRRAFAALIGEARPRSANRVEYNPDGSLDEIVTDAGVHLEHMGGRRWFLGAARSDGTEIRVWFDGKVTMVEDDAKKARA